jgi:hypothetical protein
LEYTAVWEGVIWVSKEARFAALWEVSHEFWDRENTLYVFGNIDSSVTFETISSRLLLAWDNEALNLVGLTLSISLTFFSELRKPELGDLGSLNLKVLPRLSSLEYGRAFLFKDCRSDTDFWDSEGVSLVVSTYFMELVCPFESSVELLLFEKVGVSSDAAIVDDDNVKFVSLAYRGLKFRLELVDTLVIEVLSLENEGALEFSIP